MGAHLISGPTRPAPEISGTERDELEVYVSDHRAWRVQAAPRIAAVLTQTADDERLVESWRMLREETREAVWKLLDELLRERLRTLCAESAGDAIKR